MTCSLKKEYNHLLEEEKEEHYVAAAEKEAEGSTVHRVNMNKVKSLNVRARTKRVSVKRKKEVENFRNNNFVLDMADAC